MREYEVYIIAEDAAGETLAVAETISEMSDLRRVTMAEIRRSIRTGGKIRGERYIKIIECEPLYEKYLVEA